ncbi:MAG TPA: hypothetical protein VGM94_11740 [Galbitalea sp.]
MIEAAAAVAVTGLIFVVAGLPVAFLVRRRRESWAALLTDAAMLGIVVVTLAITAGTVFGWWASFVLAAAWLAACVTFRFWASLDGLRRPQLRARPAWWIIVAVVAVVAIAFRLETVEFLPWVGDMGAYVNWANEFVRTGHLSATWPPLLPVFMAIPRWIFGLAGTTAGMSLTGLLLIAGVSRVLWRLGVNRWIVLAIAGALALNVHAIWFSTFPASESLSAPLLLAWINLLVAMIQTRSQRAQLLLCAVVFLVFSALGLLRASAGLILVPVAVVAIGSLVFASWRPLAAPIWKFFGATVLGALISFWYGIAVIPAYFVNTQVQAEIPRALFVLLKRGGALTPGPVSAALVLLAAAAIVLLAIWLPRTVERAASARSAAAAPPRTATRAWRIVLIVLAALVVVELVLLFAVGSNVAIIVLRMGVWLPVLSVIAIVGVARRHTVDAAAAIVVLLGTIVLFFCAFQTFRLGSDRPHAFYLYWDRYLFSEVFPAMSVLAGVGLAVLLRWALKSPSLGRVLRGGRATAVAACVAVVAIVASAVPGAGMLQTMADGTYMSGDYAFTNRLAAEAKAHHGPILWGATTAGPIPTFFFPNTWMAFAVPLQRSYGISIANVSQANPNFGPDAVISKQVLHDVVSCGSTALVFETQNGGSPLDDRLRGTGYVATLVAHQTSNIQLLGEPPVHGTWTRARIAVDAWRVSADPASCTG